MKKSLKKITSGYQAFQKKYANLMHDLGENGQHPETMIIGCSDSRVDPATLFQADPGDLFSVRSVANLVPVYEQNGAPNSTAAALEFGICYLKVKQLIILGHSQCGGVNALLDPGKVAGQDDFLSGWVGQLNKPVDIADPDQAAQALLLQSHQNCLSYPWIKQRVEAGELAIQLWFVDITSATVSTYQFADKTFQPLGEKQ